VTKRIMFVQAGNYGQAYKRFQIGGEENSYAQRYCVDCVAALAERDAAKTCDNFLICAPWGDLIDHWLGSTTADDAWLAGHALSADKWASDAR
jgi:hypothetical protein